MVLVLDTSFIIGLDNERDVHHNNAKKIWEEIRKGEYGNYIISDYIFDELMAVTTRKVSKERAIKLGQQILKSVPIMNIDAHMFHETWKLFLESNSNLSFTDCTNVVILKMLQSKKIATFDKAFKEVKGIETLP